MNRRYVRTVQSMTGERRLDEAADYEAGSRDQLRLAMHVASSVFSESQRELKKGHWKTAFEHGGDVQRLAYEDRRLEVRLVKNGLAIEVRRDGQVIEVLRVEKGGLVDENGSRIIAPEAHFGFMVLEFITPGSSSMLN